MASSSCNASRNAGGGGTGASFVFNRTATSTCGEWYPSINAMSSRIFGIGLTGAPSVGWCARSLRSPASGGLPTTLCS